MQYIIKKDDVLDKIAHEHHLRNGGVIWYHPNNAELRRKRANKAENLQPGDVLFIPDSPATVIVQPNTTNTLRTAAARASVEFIMGTPGTHTCQPDAPATSFVRFGLWDSAWYVGGDWRKWGTFYNEADPANNFIDADSRRFYIRVTDPAVSGKSVSVKWRTTYDNSGTVDAVQDDPEMGKNAPGASEVTLIEKIPGIFISPGLMLVCDNADANQPTNDGSGPHAFAIRGAKNYRIRRGSMFGYVEAVYGSSGLARASVFNRDPDERRSLPVQVFVLAKSASWQTPITVGLDGRLWYYLRCASSIYERLGIFLTTVSGSEPGHLVTGANGGRSYTARVVQPPLVRGYEEIDLRNVRSIDEYAILRAYPALPNTVRLFVVEGLESKKDALAEAYTDHIHPPGSALNGGCFVGVTDITETVMAHEIGHILTNKAVPGPDPENPGKTTTFVHFEEIAGTRRNEKQNLMAATTNRDYGVSGRKRLWDAADGHGFNQVQSIFNSPTNRFLRRL